MNIRAILGFILCLISIYGMAQNFVPSQLYVRIADSVGIPMLTNFGGVQSYHFNDPVLDSLLQPYGLISFDRAYPARWIEL